MRFKCISNRWINVRDPCVRGPPRSVQIENPHGAQIRGRQIDRLRSINSAPDPCVIYCAGSSLSSRRPVDVLVIESRDRSIAGREALINTCYKLIKYNVIMEINLCAYKVSFEAIVRRASDILYDREWFYNM